MKVSKIFTVLTEHGLCNETNWKNYKRSENISYFNYAFYIYFKHSSMLISHDKSFLFLFIYLIYCPSVEFVGVAG